MNYIDISIIILLVLFITFGVWRGFFDELLTLIGFVISAIISFILYHYLGLFIFSKFKFPIGISNLIGFFVFFIFLQVIWYFLSGFLYHKVNSKILLTRKFRLANKILGSLPGLMNGTIIISLILLILVITPIDSRVRSDLNSSKIAAYLISQTSAFNSQIGKLFAPAIDETRAKIRNLTGSVVYEDNYKVDFPKNLDLKIDYGAERRMLELVNTERKKRGLGELIFDDNLADAARKHSEEMFKLSYFDHISLVTGTPADRLGKAGIKYKVTGENLAYAPDVEVAHMGLMNSKSHRENILYPKYAKIGIGVVSAGYWGEMFTQEFTD